MITKPMCSVFAFLAFSLTFAGQALALDEFHRVSGSYGGSRLYSGDSLIISPNAKSTPYAQTSTDPSTAAANAAKKDSMCRSITNGSDKDYFIPWRSARLVAGGAPAGAAAPAGAVNEWTAFLAMAEAGDISGVSVGKCCYPRINPNKPCGVSYHLGKRLAGALPVSTTDPSAPSEEVPNYGAEGDSSFDVEGYNRKESWICTGGEWIMTSNEGGCYKDGRCNTYDPVANPGGYNGASVSSIPSSNRAATMCNGVEPVAVQGSGFPYPITVPGSTVYGTGGWRWSCPGQTGGTSEICYASYNNGPMRGTCGYASGRTYAAAPTRNNLCYIGTPTDVRGPTPDNKWMWACEGVNGGAASSCTANVPTTSNASCGSWGAGSRPSGLLSFEVSNGQPSASGLCSVGALAGDIKGTGSPASPWVWSCYNAANNSKANCTNVYTRPGKCGILNGMAVPATPTVSAHMCSSGRWYNKSTTGLSANSVVWNASSNKWTWACLGQDQNSGASINDQCSVGKCTECAGTVNQVMEMGVAGSYLGCSFNEQEGRLVFTGSLTRQKDATDVTGVVFWNQDYVGSFQSKTVLAPNYCSPCYQKLVDVSQARLIAPSCNLQAPTPVSIMLRGISSGTW